jgi:hypothetical protein
MSLYVDNIYVQERWSTNQTDETFAASPTNWVAPNGAWSWNAGATTWGRNGYVGPLVSFDVQSKATNAPTGPDDPADWITQQSFAVSNLSYVTNTVVFNKWDCRYVRIRHTTGAGSLVVDNLGYSSWRDTPWLATNGWCGSEVWVASNAADGVHVQLWRLRADPAQPQLVMTKYLENGVDYLAFDAYGAGGTPVTFEIRQSSPLDTNNFSTVVTSVTWTATSWAPFSVSLLDTNAMFLQIVHTSTNTNSILYLDDVQVKDYKPRDAQTWVAYNALITPKQDLREFETNATRRTCYLNDSPTLDTLTPYYGDNPFVQSSYMPFGVGEISFWYRRWTNGPDNAVVYLKTSVSETAPPAEWSLVGTITGISNTNYLYFTTNVYASNARYLRIYGSTNASVDRLCLDNVLVTEPIRSDFFVTNVTTVPEVPLDSDNAGFRAELTGFVYYPTNFRLRAYYHVGTNAWGNWPTNDYLPLYWVTNDEYRAIYASTSGIPKQPVDAVVQYYVAALWDGLLGESLWTNAKVSKAFVNPSWYYPVDLNRGQAYTNPYFFVLSCSTNAVWINEFNVRDSFPPTYDIVYTNQYIELCGKSGCNISNWWVEVLTPSFATNAAYRISQNAVLTNETKGYGFWVVGSNDVAGVDQYLTNAMPDEGGIRLWRTMGAIVDAVCYGQYDGIGMTNNPAGRFKYAGDDSYYGNYPIMLTGTGTVSTDFRNWVDNKGPHTPNGENTNQVLVEYASTQTLMVASDRGGAVPPVGGPYEYSKGTWITCWVTNSPHYLGVNATQYVCTGWAPSGSVPVPSGNPTNTGSFMILVDSSIAWNWQTNVLLDITVSGNGSVDRTGWFKQGTNLTATATPAAYNVFTGWSGDTNGCTVGSNTLTLTLSRPRGPVTASFQSTDHTLDVASAQEMAVPPAGLHTNHNNDTVTCSVTNGFFASGTTQYVCKGWNGSGSVPAMPTAAVKTNLNWGHWNRLADYDRWLSTWNSQDGTGWYVGLFADGDQTGLGNWTVDALCSNGISAGDDRIVTNTFITDFDADKMRWWPTQAVSQVGIGLRLFTVALNHSTLTGATHYAVITNANAFFTVSSTNRSYNAGTCVPADWQPLAAPFSNAVVISTGPFGITNDSTIAWLWQTNYYLSVTNVGSGTVDRASGWLAADTNVTLLASPMAGYAFQGWSGSTGGCTIAGTNIGVVADGPRAITAEFAVVSNPYTAYGTPYAWLALYYASNLDFWDTNDSDGDTMLGWMEHVTGTIPTNPLSVFRVLDVRTFGGSNRVMWYGTTNGGVTNAWSMYRATNLMMTPSPWALVVTSGIPRHASGTNTWWDLYPPAAAPILYRPMAVWTNHP